MKENVVKLSQISLQKWFVVIIPCILLAFLLISSTFIYSWILLVFYYIFIGVIYLFSQLISKIYSSQNTQKLNQKVPTNFSKQNPIPKNQNMNNSSSEISNHP